MQVKELFDLDGKVAIITGASSGLEALYFRLRPIAHQKAPYLILPGRWPLNMLL